MRGACSCELEINKDDPLQLVDDGQDAASVWIIYGINFDKGPSCLPHGASCTITKPEYSWTCQATSGQAHVDGPLNAATIKVKHEKGASATIDLAVTVKLECETDFGKNIHVFEYRNKQASGSEKGIVF